MRGSKTEWASGRWRLRVYVAAQDRQLSRQFRGTARDADKALRQFVTDVEEGRHRADNPTVADLLDRWLEHIETMGTARPYTVRSYRYVVDASLEPAFGAHKLATLTTSHLDRQYAQWLKEGVTPATVRKRHRTLSAALNQAVKWDMVPKAVTRNASLPPEEPPDPRAMSPEEVMALVRACEDSDPVLGAAVALAAATGARRGELCGLRWADYIEATGILTISRSITVVGGEVHEQTTKTRRVRRLNVGPLGAEVLANRRNQQEKLAADAGTRLVSNPWILSRRADGGAPVKPHGISNAFSREARKIGLPYHFHELRHWVATTAIASGADPRSVAGHLGHANPTLTMRVYAKFIESADLRLVESLGRALRPASEDPE